MTELSLDQLAEGLVDPEPGAPESPPGAEAPRVPAEVQAILDQNNKLLEELQREGKRRADSQAAFHAEHEARRAEERRVAMLMEQQRREQAMWERARNQPFTMPEVDEDTFLADPVKNLERFGQAVYAQAQAAADARLQPLLQQVGAGLQQVRSLAGTAVRRAVDDARQEYESRGFDDWDEIFPEVEADLRDGGPPYQELLAQKDSILDAIILKRRKKGLRLEPVRDPASTQAPPTIGSRSSGDSETPEVFHLSPHAQRIWRQLNLDPNDKLTEAEVRDLSQYDGLLRGAS